MPGASSYETPATSCLRLGWDSTSDSGTCSAATGSTGADGRFVNKQVPDPGDLLLLKLRVRVDGREHSVQPFLNGTPVPVVLPWAPRVERSQRALVVVNNTVAGGRADLRDLYRFIEAAGDAVAHAPCGPVYADVRSLNGSNATLAALVATLRTLAARPELRAIDLILNMHGEPDTMFFHGAPGVAVDQVCRQLQSTSGVSGKLRLLYNTSC